MSKMIDVCNILNCGSVLTRQLDELKKANQKEKEGKGDEAQKREEATATKDAAFKKRMRKKHEVASSMKKASLYTRGGRTVSPDDVCKRREVYG